MSYSEDSIKVYNDLIKKKLEEVVTFLKENNISVFQNGKLIDEVNNILNYEMRKNVLIYKAMFPQFECKDIDELKVMGVNELGFECRGNENGVRVYSGIQPFIDGDLKNARLEWIEDQQGLAYCIKLVTKDDKQSLTPNYQRENTKKDSTRDQADYFAEILQKGKIDLDVILDVLPHETMHIFVPGKGVLVEGTTEWFSRIAADRFGLRLTPTSHQRETEIVSRLERIVGTDVISSISLSNEQNERRRMDDSSKDDVENDRYKLLEEKLDEKMGKGTFKKMKHIFDEQYTKFLKKEQSNFQKYRDPNYYKDENGQRCN